MFSTFHAIKSFCSPGSFYRPKWQTLLPFNIPQLGKSLPFHIPKVWKRYPFRAEHPHMDYNYRGFFSGPLFLTRSNLPRFNRNGKVFIRALTINCCFTAPIYSFLWYNKTNWKRQQRNSSIRYRQRIAATLDITKNVLVVLSSFLILPSLFFIINLLG